MSKTFLVPVRSNLGLTSAVEPIQHAVWIDTPNPTPAKLQAWLREAQAELLKFEALKVTHAKLQSDMKIQLNRNNMLAQRVFTLEKQSNDHLPLQQRVDTYEKKKHKQKTTHKHT